MNNLLFLTLIFQICYHILETNITPRTHATSFTRRHILVCLFGFNVAYKHLRSNHDGACL